MSKRTVTAAFVLTFACMLGLVLYQSVFGYNLLKSRTVSGMNYDVRSRDRPVFGAQEIIETSRSVANRLEITLNFKAFSIDRNTILFQTAPHDGGVTLVLQKPNRLSLIAGTRYAPGYKLYTVSEGVQLGVWHNFSLAISPSKRIIIKFDDLPVVDAPDTELVTGIADFKIGRGDDASVSFNGEIRDASLVYDLYAPATSAQSPFPRILELLLFAGNLIALYLLSGFPERGRENNP